MPITRPDGDVTLDDIVTLWIEAPWNLSLPKGIAMRALRKVRNFFFGEVETNIWFAKRYNLVAWFAATYPPSRSPMTLVRGGKA